MTIPADILLYRLIHWKNIDHILRNGMCCQEHPKADPNYINIGHQQLIQDRHNYQIPLPNAGTLGEYIPFYFAGHSPMLYLIMNGYKGVQQIPQEDLVYVVTSIEKIKQAGLDFVITDMNAKLALARFYNNERDLSNLRWDIIKDRYWNNTEDNISRRDYKQAEFLVRHYLPVDCILKIVVKTTARKHYFNNLIAKLALQIPVEVDTNCNLYY